ncbi:FixH family protein [Gayadomonas joobiniege]|uniref:FixH family protein n=1 Tax=Gayadomonas joobiniege TaxID=1234606 RepID=UPI000366DE03|nr:FixH family protein [Gayadomonas joobiniege]
MTDSAFRPWYKEPWPWVLITIIVVPMLVAVVRLNIYNEYKVDMVVDDYYKKGKAINQEFDREDLAAEYNIVIFAQINSDNIVLELNHNRKLKEVPSLFISFYHSTQSEKDFKVIATQRADGKYSASFDHAIDGKWQLTFESHDKSWKLQKNVYLPYSDKILIKP